MSADTIQLKRPLHPLLVLTGAIVFPGLGQLLNGMANRGLVMVLFMVLLGWVSYWTTTPEHSFVGRYAGGFFIYAISIVDAYRWARVRTTVFAHDHG